ncbi:hypothetical protein C8F04DRAFT_1272592 [Mycena alexandri]|uniref:RING-type domain-containing protein n=1 Tax=Mycena alexandri TaxID=1745969 RepID=A0AAD6SBH8_9AGAR|nr:hypothetical protein C8F04DRAFT_1272592 [Mycena alexandri]
MFIPAPTHPALNLVFIQMPAPTMRLGFADLRRVGSTPDNPIVMDRAGRIIFDCVAVPRARPPQPSPPRASGSRPRNTAQASPPRASGSRSGNTVQASPRASGVGTVYKGIMGGLPSAIPRSDAGRRLFASMTTRSTTHIRVARVDSGMRTAGLSTAARAALRSPATVNDENRPPSVPRHRRRSTRAYQGSRVARPPGAELKEDDLYLSAARPVEATSPDSDLTCGICFQIKSHPVQYNCKHSHCYVCIRQWLEHSFQCPQCRAKMTSRPVPDDQVAAAIVQQHPSWKDDSRIEYSWTGLTFPIPYPSSPIV